MTRQKLNSELKTKLQRLSRNEVVEFAWRCGLRALPLLGIDDTFSYWPREKIQKNLQTILFALDLTKYHLFYYDSKIIRNSAFDEAIADVSRAASQSRNGVAFAAANAATFAVSTARASKDDKLFKIFKAASNAAFHAARADELIEFILDDIDSILLFEPPKVFIESYGLLWEKFLLALKRVGCEYLANLYQNLFENNFEINFIDLERRLNVPREIRENGAAALSNYLEQLEKGAKRLDEARIIILGDKGAGKTCVARRIVNPKAPMTTKAESTAGVDTHQWVIKEVKKDEIKISIWDFAGHTVTHAVHRFFLSERCLYIMVYNGRTENSNRLIYWLNHMKNFGGDSKAIILVNKQDNHKVTIPINNLKEEYPILGVYNFSIKEDFEELEKFRSDIADYIKNNPSWKKQDIPLNYYEVKEELEDIFYNASDEKRLEHISKKEFENIAQRHKVEDTNQLLKDLHALGISLWYQQMEQYDTLVLNPEWISHGVYKIINWANNLEKPSINIKDFPKIFKEDLERYSVEKSHNFLFDLMKHYELAYQPKSAKRLIIPHLLKEDRPDRLPVFKIDESLFIKYRAEQTLPPNTISRFIVRHHQQIKNNRLLWRYGVVLEDGKGGLALIREEDRTISVSVKGKGKSGFIDELRTTLNDIFDSYKSEKPELQYRIQRFGEIVT